MRVTRPNPTGVESFDHTAVSRLREYRAAVQALDKLVHEKVCSGCGSRHWKEGRGLKGADIICVICRVPHLGYCFESDHEGPAPRSESSQRAAATGRGRGRG